MNKINNPLQFLRDLKSVTFSTSEGNRPYSRIIDLMRYENEKLYFITARGKMLYRQLRANPWAAIVGMDAQYRTVRLYGKVRFTESRDEVDKVFVANPVMNDLYPGEKRYVLECFVMDAGIGEIFDLSLTPPVRERFAFGGSEVIPLGFSITDQCTGCGICRDVCPVQAISEGVQYEIDSGKCLECGLCYEKCPADAIRKPRDFSEK